MVCLLFKHAQKYIFEHLCFYSHGKLKHILLFGLQLTLINFNLKGGRLF
jgi:hypothetical protein